MENDFIQTHTSGPTSIGLTDEIVEGTFMWASGSSATYTAWLLSQPDGGATENCAFTSPSGFLEDRFCQSFPDFPKLPYICELSSAQ